MHILSKTQIGKGKIKHEDGTQAKQDDRKDFSVNGRETILININKVEH